MAGGSDTSTAAPTLGERVRRAREAKKIKTSGALTRLLNKHGYEVSRQAVAALERGAVAVPRPGLISALSEVLDVSEDDLRYGPRGGEDYFVAQVRGLAPDLAERQRDQLLYLANEMAQETRARREAAEREDPLVTTLKELLAGVAGLGPEHERELRESIARQFQIELASAAPAAPATPRRRADRVRVAE